MTDELIAAVIAAVRPARPDGHGAAAWAFFGGYAGVAPTVAGLDRQEWGSPSRSPCAVLACLVRELSPAGRLSVRLGEPLVDDYLEFVVARCRPNTVLATAYDLKVFFEVVGKDCR